MKIEWSNSLSIGVEKVDNQHKELIKRLNDLFEACTQNKAKEEIGRTIDFLGSYVIEHFTDEEKLMQMHGYPGYSTQKSQHDNFIMEFTKLKEQFEAEGGNVLIILKANRMLTDWLNNHISKEDKKIGDYINSKF